MVNNFTDINKTNNQLNSLNTIKITTYAVGNPGPGFGQAKNVAGLNWLMGSQPSTLDN
jgi:hypothetical protein